MTSDAKSPDDPQHPAGDGVPDVPCWFRTTFVRPRRGGACPSRGLRITPDIRTTPYGRASPTSRLSDLHPMPAGGRGRPPLRRQRTASHLPRRGRACPARKNGLPVRLYEVAQIVRESFADTVGTSRTPSPTAQTHVSAQPIPFRVSDAGRGKPLPYGADPRPRAADTRLRIRRREGQAPPLRGRPTLPRSRYPSAILHPVRPPP